MIGKIFLGIAFAFIIGILVAACGINDIGQDTIGNKDIHGEESGYYTIYHNGKAIRVPVGKSKND